MANPVVRDTYIGAMAPLLFWDGQSVRVQVCPLCYYWPINGEELKPVCVHCKTAPKLSEDHLPDIYRTASGQQWLMPCLLTLKDVGQNLKETEIKGLISEKRAMIKTVGGHTVPQV